MPICVFEILQFRIVLELFPLPVLDVLILVPPKPIPNSVCVFAFPVRLMFFTVLFVAASLPEEVCPQMTAEEVPEFVLVSVRSRELEPLFQPSIVT